MQSLEHIEEFMTSAGPESAEKLVSSYAHLNSLLSKPLETQTAIDPKDPKKVPITTLKPTFLCLQCATISTREERDAHCKLKKHVLCESPLGTSCDLILTHWSAMESRSGCLWCGQCDDFVYDPGLERIRVGATFPTHSMDSCVRSPTAYHLLTA